MDKKRVALTKQQFDSAVHNHGEAKVEYWFARELMPLLGYERWENFERSRKWFLWAVVSSDP